MHSTLQMLYQIHCAVDCDQAAVSASSLDCGEGVSQLSCARMVMEASINSTGHLNSMAAESVDTGTDDSIRIPLLGYHLFGVFWCANFYSAMKTMIIAAAVAEVFWTKAKVKEEKRWATKDAFCYIFRWHMGSAAFGIQTTHKYLNIAFFPASTSQH
eukprot:SAG31_NODE_1924_length_6902_cov_5.916066_7_plen_157_part_00